METPKTPLQQQQEALAAEGKKNQTKKIVTITGIIVAALVVIVLVWMSVVSHRSAKADEAIALADVEQNDSIALKYYQDAAKLGQKSGNRAKLHAAILLYQDGKYQDAINYLKDASVKSDLVEAGQYSLMGDCYVNLKDYDKALKCYDEAIDAADENPQVVPFVLVKMANVYRAQQNYAAEAKAYETIIKDYPGYMSGLRFDIRKYAERAKAAAEAAGK